MVKLQKIKVKVENWQLGTRIMLLEDIFQGVVLNQGAQIFDKGESIFLPNGYYEVLPENIIGEAVENSEYTQKSLLSSLGAKPSKLIIEF
jgi:hypothetical protein